MALSAGPQNRSSSICFRAGVVVRGATLVRAERLARRSCLAERFASGGRGASACDGRLHLREVQGGVHLAPPCIEPILFFRYRNSPCHRTPRCRRRYMNEEKILAIGLFVLAITCIAGVTKCTMDRNQLAHDTMVQRISQHGTWVSGSGDSSSTSFGTCVLPSGGSK